MIDIEFSGADQVAKLVHYTTEYPPCHGSQTLQDTIDKFSRKWVKGGGVNQGS